MAMRTSTSSPASARHSASAIDRVWRTNCLHQRFAELGAAGSAEPAAEARCAGDADAHVADVDDGRRHRRAPWRRPTPSRRGPRRRRRSRSRGCRARPPPAPGSRRDLRGEHGGLGRRAVAGQVAGDEQQVGGGRPAAPAGRGRDRSRGRRGRHRPRRPARTSSGDVLDVRGRRRRRAARPRCRSPSPAPARRRRRRRRRVGPPSPRCPRRGCSARRPCTCRSCSPTRSSASRASWRCSGR